MADLNRIKTVLAERGIMAHPHTLPTGFVGCAEKRVESHICICFMAYKVYKELERIIRIAGIDLSVDAVLKIAKTIATIRINMPNNNSSIQQTLLLTPAHHRIKALFDIKSILNGIATH